MKIVALSDTHYSDDYKIPNALIKEIDSSDIIIHCGDFISYNFFSFLNSTNKLYAALGNGDYRLSKYLETTKEVKLGKYKAIITHGDNINLNNLSYTFYDYDIIFFGHTHDPIYIKENEKHLINPGSVTNNRYKNYNSFAVITINDELKIEFHKL